MADQPLQRTTQMSKFKMIPLAAVLGASTLAAAALLPALPALADSAMKHAMSVTAGDITVSQPMARFMIAGRPGAVFLTIENKGEADRLLSASSPMTGRVELHTHTMDNGVMKMRQIEAIDIAANATTELKSGGLHIMLFGIEELPAKGAMIPLTLTFEKAGTIEINAMVSDAKGMSH